MSKQLPKRIYVKHVKDQDVEYLDANADPRQLSEQESVVIAGEYELKKVVKLLNTTAIVDAEFKLGLRRKK